MFARAILYVGLSFPPVASLFLQSNAALVSSWQVKHVKPESGLLPLLLLVVFSFDLIAIVVGHVLLGVTCGFPVKSGFVFVCNFAVCQTRCSA